MGPLQLVSCSAMVVVTLSSLARAGDEPGCKAFIDAVNNAPPHAETCLLAPWIKAFETCEGSLDHSEPEELRAAIERLTSISRVHCDEDPQLELKRRLLCRAHWAASLDDILGGLASFDPQTHGECIVGLALNGDPNAAAALSAQPLKGADRESIKGVIDAIDRVMRLSSGVGAQLGGLLLWVDSGTDADVLKTNAFHSICTSSMHPPDECNVLKRKSPYSEALTNPKTDGLPDSSQRVRSYPSNSTGIFLAASLGIAAGLTGLSYAARDVPFGRAVATFNGVVGGIPLGAGLGFAISDSRAYGKIFGFVLGAFIGAITGGICGFLTTSQPGLSRPLFSGITLGAGVIVTVPLVAFVQ